MFFDRSLYVNTDASPFFEGGINANTCLIDLLWEMYAICSNKTVILN